MARSDLFHEALMTLWPLGRALYWLSNRRVLRPLSRPFFKALDSEAMIIPVHETIPSPESMVLPYPLLSPLIEHANARFLMKECMCRRGEDCQTYPQDFGCLFLGDGATSISPSLGRLVGSDEALAHVRQSLVLGLVPLVVHTTFDAMVLGISYRHMLGICFCCDCCCTVQQGMRLGPPAFWDIVVRVPGLTVTVNGACSGCGACQEACYVNAITLYGGRAEVDHEICKGCGRCVLTCPTGAIRLRVDNDADVMRRFLERVAQRADIGLTREYLRSDCT
ncbi:MAG: DUF362 domain-containing protein [Chloroflexota bacterium]